MRNKILTISVAAYNVEKYLRKALDSLIVDEILTDIEVIVVDDGGQDGSYEIAKEYERKYPDTFIAIHKENGGYGSTINYSIKNAMGKYFKILDGDDFFDKNGLLELVRLLKDIDADVVFTQYNYAFGNNLKLAIKYDTKIVDRVLPIEKFSFNAGTPMHALAYKTSVLKESQLRLKEHSLYTDNTYAAVPFVCIKNMYFKNIVVYNYSLGIDGQSVSREGLVRHIEESKDISLDLVDFYAKNVKEDNKALNAIKVNIASTCVNYVVGVLKMPMARKSLDRLIEFDKRVKETSKVIYDKMVDIDRKASKSLYYIRKSNYLLYWLFSFIYRFIN